MSDVQDNRDLVLASPLVDDSLILRSIHFSEQLGRPFHAELEITSDKFDLDFSTIVGQNVTIGYFGGTDPRYFNGYVSRFAQSSAQHKNVSYTATVVPFLWFLTRNADCRIFQNISIPDIVKQILADRGYSDVIDQLTGTYGPWEYCVQYRETDFNFISRLMEQEGIYYFFKHEDGKHSIVLMDDPTVHQPYPKYDEIRYRSESADGAAEFIRDWTVEQELQPGSVTLNDFDFTAPRKSLMSASRIQRTHAAANFEIYDYPGEFTQAGDGTEYAKVRIQELQSQFEIARASSDSVGICTGCTFTMADFPREDQNRKYLITSASYQISADDSKSGGGGGGGGGGGSASIFSSHFTAIDATTPFRPPRITPKPSVQGPQTALVVGKSGEEIFTDQYGRVKVQFFWDRYGTADDQSSCWIRVAQVWAGTKWGAVFVPRMGQEVIVEFLEGDPDQPIITGRVYNAINMPPYALPANKTRSGIKTNSTLGGQGFNEIRFEDKKGSEQLFTHAEKDQDVRVKNDSKEWVGNDRHLVVKNMQFEHIELDRHETIDRDHQEKIGRDRHTTIAGKEAKSVATTLSLQVTGNVAEVFKANHSEQVASDYYLKADNIVIEGMTSITIKVGSNYIAIDGGGIKISSTGTFDTESTGPTGIKSTAAMSIESQATASLKAAGPLSVQSQAQAELKAPITSVQGQGTLTLKGGITMIN
jgi:type VI secretion system secreted protein VgrG